MTSRHRNSIRFPGSTRRLRLESLERRRLLAAEIFPTDLPDHVDQEQSSLVSTASAESEPEPDLVQFAKDLTAAGAQFFGAAWCPACTAQKQLFEDGGNELPFIEVTNPDRTLNSIGQPQNEDITVFPTWKFPSGAVVTGVQSLDELAALLGNGYAIPQSEQPTFESIGNQTVGIGSPLHIPVDAYDSEGGPLTVTVTVDDPTLVQAIVLSGNRSIRFDMEGWGDMVFELFEQRVPVPTGRVADLADADFYDGLKFHRVANNFVLQGGDPNGNGTGGSSLGDFDDQFHPDLQHNRSGILSFAKGADDTNNSQFFITEPATRHLDFNHSIFGQLVEGDDVREAISETAVNGSTPTIDVVMTSIDVFTDQENSVVMLKALAGTGSTNVTFTVTDQDGNAHSETISVTVANDIANGQPFLEPLNVPSEIFVNQKFEFQIQSFDVEGDAVRYDSARVGGDIEAEVIVDAVTGVVTITPEFGAEGELVIGTLVAPGQGVIGNGSSDFDRQDFVLSVVPAPPFHNVNDPPNVDGLDGPSALDALLIINAMFNNGGEIDLASGDTPGLDPDINYNVNGDLRISALDALQVINAIGNSEPQQSAAADQTSNEQAVQIAFAGHAASSPIFSMRDDDDKQWIALLASYQLGLQGIE